MQFLPQRGRDLSAFMRTCWDFYNASISHTLSGTVVIKSWPKHMASFTKFIKNDITQRSMLLRNLEIEPPWGWSHWDSEGSDREQEPRILQEFTTVLQQASRLCCIQLMGSEGWLELCPGLGSIIPSLPSLNALYVSGSNERTAALLNSCKDSIRVLGISFAVGDTFRKYDRADPRLMLGIVPSVEEFAVKRLTLRQGEEEEDNIVAINIRTLRIEEWDGCGFVDMRPLIRTFPNIRNLLLYPGTLLDYPAELSRRRAVNITAQAGKKWQNLDYCEGELAALYALAPRCRIAHLNIDLNSYVYDYLPDVMQDARPSRIHHRFSLGFESSIDDLSNIAPPLTDCTTVTHLELTFEVWPLGLWTRSMTAIEVSTGSKLLDRCTSTDPELNVIACDSRRSSMHYDALPDCL